MRKRSFLFVAALFCLMAPPLFAQEEADIVAEEAVSKKPYYFQVESDFYSRYVWYALAASEGPVWQPSASFGFYGFKFTAWGNFVLNNEPNQGQFNEVDLIFQYENIFHKLGYLFSVEGDMFPHGNPKSLDASNATLKTNARFTYPVGPLQIFTDFAALFVSVEGGVYGDLGIEWTAPLSKYFSVDTWFLFGIGDEKFNRTHIADIGTSPNLLDYALLFSWNPDKHWTLTPNFHVSYLLFEPVRAARPHQTQIWGGLQMAYLF